MKQTVLELTQSILSSMNSDEINSIADTVESNDIAILLRDVYYDIAVELNLDAHESLFELEDSGNADQPVLMFLPENVSKLYWIKYNNQLVTDTNSSYLPVCHKDFDDFYIMQNGLRENTNTGEMSFDMNSEDFEIMYATDRMPTWYTHVGNETLIFDAVDLAEDTTLQKEKTMCGGLIYPTFELEDSFVPVLDAAQFPYYRNRAKVRAFAEQKQVQNAEAAGEARNQKVLMQKRKSRINEGPAIKQLQARYGRK
jgi:hypothetical protein